MTPTVMTSDMSKQTWMIHSVKGRRLIFAFSNSVHSCLSSPRGRRIRVMGHRHKNCFVFSPHQAASRIIIRQSALQDLLEGAVDGAARVDALVEVDGLLCALGNALGGKLEFLVTVSGDFLGV
jgi:hypothetical protein